MKRIFKDYMAEYPAHIDIDYFLNNTHGNIEYNPECLFTKGKDFIPSLDENDIIIIIKNKHFNKF